MSSKTKPYPFVVSMHCAWSRTALEESNVTAAPSLQCLLPLLSWIGREQNAASLAPEHNHDTADCFGQTSLIIVRMSNAFKPCRLISS